MNQLAPQDCLFEIGCEELPTAALQPLIHALAQSLEAQLLEAQLTFTKIEQFVTPRRLAILISDLANEQAERILEQFGPPSQQAYDSEGKPTAACIGFARTCGVLPQDLKIKATAKGERLVYYRKESGMKTSELLPQFFKKALTQLPIPKPMRWNAHQFTFVRPVHWVVLLYGNQCINTNILGLPTHSHTYGHRFLHPDQLNLVAPRQYEQQLTQQGFVIPDFDKRRQHIATLIKQSLLPHETAVIDPNLLDEVTALVEWPVALRAQFKAEFLQVPQEVLIAAMQTHQKCFAVIDGNKQIQPVFIVISNIVSQDPKAVINGNERVMNARLADAAFFYQNDCKMRLTDIAPKLHHVIFQQQLGTLAQKTQRLVTLAESIAKDIAANVVITGEAAAIAKCDLLTEMVGEFPELQGTMGYYYALHGQFSTQCALAIKQHYWPRFAGDQLPTELEGCALALADRIDTLVGILGINQAPTGDKDPFALRRIALGIARILIEKSLPLDLESLLKQAQYNYAKTVTLPNQQIVTEALQFILQRLKAWYLDKNVSIDVFNAVLACQPTVLMDFDKRIWAVTEFKALPQAATLSTANKRVSNMLKKQQESIPEIVVPSLLTHPAEKKLTQVLAEKSAAIQSLCQLKDYKAALSQLATFKPAVDDFFDHVLVMVDDQPTRLNRLALLTQLRQLFIEIADIALLQ